MQVLRRSPKLYDYAGVTESADVADSKSVAERRVGSSPTTSTTATIPVGVVVVGEKARNSIKSLDKGQGAEPMAR